ncbi:MAG: hypothetical protein ACXWDM_05305 [Nocardioides sp.]
MLNALETIVDESGESGDNDEGSPVVVQVAMFSWPGPVLVDGAAHGVVGLQVDRRD